MSASRDVIYLDNNATTPLDPRVLEAMMPYLTDRYGNAASRTHAFGWEAEKAVDHARAQIARLIGARPHEIVYTSGATESTNLALRGLMERYADRGDHLVTVCTEHKATLDTAKLLEKQGKRVTVLPVARDGMLDLAKLEAALEDRTLVVSVMMVNNEIGVVQPIEEIGALCAERNVFLHCDAAQGFGKIPIDVGDLGVHLMSVSAHKIYGPKGVGILYVRGRDPKVDLEEQIKGGGHEGGRRSGTLNVPGIVGLGAAADIAVRELEEEVARIGALRDRLQERLLAAFPDAVINGNAEHRVPGTLNISFPGVESEALLMIMTDVAVSTGSACTSTSVEPSYVLRACGIPDDVALSAVRFGVGRFNTEGEIDRAAETVIRAVSSLRPSASGGRKKNKDQETSPC